MNFEIGVDKYRLLYVLYSNGCVIKESKSAKDLYDYANTIAGMMRTADVYNQRFNCLGNNVEVVA